MKIKKVEKKETPAQASAATTAKKVVYLCG